MTETKHTAECIANAERLACENEADYGSSWTRQHERAIEANGRRWLEEGDINCVCQPQDEDPLFETRHFDYHTGF